MFILAPRARHRDLALLCRRLSTSLEAGIDIRRVFAREATSHLPRAMRRHLEHISQSISGGQSLSEALEGTGDYFPPLFRALVRVGEQTGHLDSVFGQLAESYEYQEQLRREFMASIAWPMIELSLALVTVGLIIWITGFFADKKDLTGQPIDLLGWGLKGTDGLIKYFAILGCIFVAVTALVQSIRRGVVWGRPLQRLALYIPKLGGALQTFALARMAWSMHITLGAGMDLLKALPLCLRSMQNATYTDHIASVTESVRRGETVTEALSATRVFPASFLDVIDVGERSGRLPESMVTVSRQYQDEARRALALITRIAGMGVWLMVAGLIAMLIFRIFGFYMSQINAVL